MAGKWWLLSRGEAIPPLDPSICHHISQMAGSLRTATLSVLLWSHLLNVPTTLLKILLASITNDLNTKCQTLELLWIVWGSLKTLGLKQAQLCPDLSKARPSYKPPPGQLSGFMTAIEAWVSLSHFRRILSANWNSTKSDWQWKRANVAGNKMTPPRWWTSHPTYRCHVKR